MNLIFFGAGASFGSDKSNVPPLGSALFAELQRHSPSTWGLISQTWAQNFQQDFEQAMSQFIAQGHFAAPLQWAMADYFYKGFPISNTNLYITLLKDISYHLGDFLVATINYDTLLFQAAQKINLQIVFGSLNHPGSTLPVCLPHGSSVLCCEGLRATRGISFTGGISTSGSPRIFSDINDFDKEKATNAFPPIMSYYEPSKFTASCANFIKQERKIFSQWITQASKIAIIGVNVHPVDEHIWNPISSAKGQVFCLSGNNGSLRYNSWSNKIGRTNDIISNKYFSTGYTELKKFFGI